jgi:hypothetical protein
MIVRKVSIGVDLLKAMHYQVGKPVLGGSGTIKDIIVDVDGFIDIYVSRDFEGTAEILKWKSVSPSVPTIIEYSIDF